jgi:hypothetical protein
VDSLAARVRAGLCSASLAHGIVHLNSIDSYDEAAMHASIYINTWQQRSRAQQMRSALIAVRTSGMLDSSNEKKQLIQATMAKAIIASSPTDIPAILQRELTKHFPYQSDIICHQTLSRLMCVVRFVIATDYLRLICNLVSSKQIRVQKHVLPVAPKICAILPVAQLIWEFVRSWGSIKHIWVFFKWGFT